MVACSVVGCKSQWNPFTDVTFHRVTKNKKYLHLWRRVVTIKPSPYGKICSLHFRSADFVGDGDQKRLRREAVPSFNIVEKATNTDDDDDDDDDNKNLSMLKEILTSNGNNKTTDHSDVQSDEETDNYNSNPQDFEMVISCSNPIHSFNLETPSSSNQTRDTGTQVERKTEKETSLQARIKVLTLRLRRRDAKISYMKTVFNMIKKHIKGTDMEYKLCCELENISESIKSSSVNEVTIKKDRSDSPLMGFDNYEAESSGDEQGMCMEVVFSPNLKVRNGAEIKR